MSDIKKYLSLEGLSQYHGLIKGYIDDADKQLNGELTELKDLIAILDAKLGDWGSDNSDSDFVSVESAIAEIKDSIENIRKEGGENDDKIEEAINGIEVELGNITAAIEKLNGEDTVEGSVKNIAKSYAGAAQEAAKAYVNGLVKDAEGNIKFDAVGSAEQALAAAQAYVDGKVDGKFDEAGAAAAAQAAAIAAASADATSKANDAKAAAKEYVNGLVKDAEGNVKFDEKGAAAAAETAAKAYADRLGDNYDAAGSAADALTAAKKYVKEDISLEYDSNNKLIKIIDKEGNLIGSTIDASAFITEGILKDVDFAFVDGSESDSDESNNTTLRFTFDTDNGDKVIDIDFSNYVDIYRADGKSIVMEENNTFSIKEVAASQTKLGQKITIAGGPLANNIEEQGEVWPAKWKNGNEKFIPEDATVYDIVMNLFCVEKWPVKSNGNTNVTTSVATLKSTINAPSMTYNNVSTNGGSSTVEVGSTVEYSISNGASGNEAIPHKASGFTYGYSKNADNSKDNSNPYVSATFNDNDGKTTVAIMGDSVPTLTIEGKVSETVNGTAGSASAGSATKSGSVVIEEGDNKISAKCTSVKYSGTCKELLVHYGCSNLGNTDTNGDGTGTTYPSTYMSETYLESDAKESSKVTINCVGAYKYFYGYPSGIPANKEEIVKLSNSGFLSGSELSVTTAGTVPVGKYMIVAVPKGWEYASFVNGMNLDDVSAFYTATEEVDYTLDNNEVVKYSVHWCGPFGADTNYNSFKITKK